MSPREQLSAIAEAMHKLATLQQNLWHALREELAEAGIRVHTPSELAAQQALQQIAGADGPRSVAAWRRFVAELRGEGR